jgi:hypothetical protein
VGTHDDGGEQAGPECGNSCILVIFYLHSVAAVVAIFTEGGLSMILHFALETVCQNLDGWAYNG